jgi:hypothetical protein
MTKLHAPIVNQTAYPLLFIEEIFKVLVRRSLESQKSAESASAAVPLQAWSGPEGSRKLRFPDFMITAQDGGKVVGLTHRPPLPQGNTPGNHFC